MRWSRIKNIIILLLVVVNIFLLALVGLGQWRTRQGERETRERMIAVLANNGIEFLPEEVPGSLELTGYQVVPALPGEEEAQALVGNVSSVERIGSRTTYVGEWGRVTFSTTGEMEAVLRPNVSVETEEGLQILGRELLEEKLGLQVRSGANIPTSGGERGACRYVQLWEGADAPAYTQRLSIGAEGLELSGRLLLAGEWSALTGQGETITASTALTRFLEALNREGYVCSQITGMYPGYLTGGSNTVKLTPAWYIETAAWPWRFAVDGYTGAVTAAE